MPTRRDPRELGAIFVGGMVGALARVWIGERLAASPTSWPWATFLVNVAGSVILAWVATRLPRSTYRRALIGIGFCGALTTFSTMQVEILNMLDVGRDGLAVGYAAASIAVGYLAVLATTLLVRRAREPAA